MIYKCEICGNEFNSATECKKHEKSCGSRENLLLIIKGLKTKIINLENALELMGKSFPTYHCPTPWDESN